MFRKKPPVAPQAIPAPSAPIPGRAPVVPDAGTGREHWPLLSAVYSATSGELPDINVNVTHHRPGVLTVHLGLALTPTGWSFGAVTPYPPLNPHIDPQDGTRVFSVNAELRRRLPNISEYVTLHLYSHTASPSGYHAAQVGTDDQGRYNLTLMAKGILTGPVRHAQSVPIKYKEEIPDLEDESGRMTLPGITEESWDDTN
jgi:hypothetical protein